MERLRDTQESPQGSFLSKSVFSQLFPNANEKKIQESIPSNSIALY
jgi:hypothetical protein